jgi:DNA-binding NarL/FixJ family response regulator
VVRALLGFGSGGDTGRPDHLIPWHFPLQSSPVGSLRAVAGRSRCSGAVTSVTSTLIATAAGGRVVDPALAVAALSEGSNPLSDREREVLATSTELATIAEIANRLTLSEGTVRNHLSTAIQKVGARNRAAAARLAVKKGWLEPDITS